MRLLLFTTISMICAVYAEKTCVDKDIEFLGFIYNCSILEDPTDPTGFYDLNDVYCNNPMFECCETCKRIQNCNRGIELPGYSSSIDCKFLLKEYDEDRNVGVYANRVALCEKQSSRCCKQCEQVQNEAAGITTTKTVRPTITPKTSAPVTTVIKELRDDCVDNCLWYADGSQGTCSWLTDSTSDAYNFRKRLCNGNNAPGCAKSCHVVLNEVTTPAPTTTSTEKPTTKLITQPQGCYDIGHITYGKKIYVCIDLQNDQSDIYNNRHAICNTVKAQSECCATCNKVANEKPVSNSNENEVIKSSSSNESSEPQTAQQTQSQMSYSQVFQLMEEERQRAQEQTKILFKRLSDVFRLFGK